MLLPIMKRSVPRPLRRFNSKTVHQTPTVRRWGSYSMGTNEPTLMTRYDVICPSAPWENETTDADRAWDLCLDLSEEYGYAQVRCNGVIIGEYTDGH